MLLYIHIPFCESKCPYCAFGSLTGKSSSFEPYFQALLKDLKQALVRLDKPEFSSVFIGGGTPSAVSAKLYAPLFEFIEPFLQNQAEISIEANPNSASPQWLSYMRSLGANRLSLGAQSFYADKLKMLGRTHCAEAVKKAVSQAKKAGFSRISVDIIYGTSLDDEKRIKGEVKAIKALQIEHASAYTLTLEENTPFENKLELSKDDESLAMLMIDELNSAGLKQYEVSNFGNPCLHNLGYWQGTDYLGIGAFSVGCIDKKRLYASKNLNSYIQNPSARQVEALSPDDIALERLFLGLRSCVGINQDELKSPWLERALMLEKEAKLSKKGKTLVANNLMLADELALFISA